MFITDFHCFPKCFLGAQTRKHLLKKQDVSEQIQKPFCFRNKRFLGLQTGKHLLSQKCFRKIASSFAGAFGIVKNYLVFGLFRNSLSQFFYNEMFFKITSTTQVIMAFKPQQLLA